MLKDDWHERFEQAVDWLVLATEQLIDHAEGKRLVRVLWSRAWSAVENERDEMCGSCLAGDCSHCHPWTGLFGPEKRPCRCRFCGRTSS